MPIKSDWSKKNYFNPRWQKALSKTLETTYNCSVIITETDSDSGEFDPRTGETTYANGATLEVYRGKARAQPRGSSLDRSNQAADTNVRRMQFQIPLHKASRIMPNMLVKVTEADLYPVITTYDYRVQGTVNSGNPIEITFIAMIDEEVNSGN